MIPRHLAGPMLKYAKEYPILALVGPRQSGKTTLAKSLFKGYTYLSLENLDLRDWATQDPRGFLEDHGKYLILDEVQRVPELFPYLQEKVDNDQEAGQYILTGSSQFLLLESITQSLAGRIATFKLYPLSFLELYHYPPDKSFDSVFQILHSTRDMISQQQLYNMIWKGFYPRVHDKEIDSYKWYENYLLTYVERDVRNLLRVNNLRTFTAFLKLVSAQAGQLINFSNLSNSLGVSLPTVKNWISILETSGIIFILPPFFQNYSKRLVKTPKLYFADTGLLCHLLSIRSKDHLKNHPLIGSIFENFIVAEAYKRFFNLAETPPLYFWRDPSGLEVDLLIDKGLSVFPIEIKISQTYHTDFKKGIEKWLTLSGYPDASGAVIYCGKEKAGTHSNIMTAPWYLL
jgi:predicted AAA+ superfamily ATPase